MLTTNAGMMMTISSTRVATRGSEHAVWHATRRAAAAVVFAAAVMINAGCHGLLDVSDPTLVQDKDIANAGGANSRRLDALGGFYAGFPILASDVALFTDERMEDQPVNFPTLDANGLLDARDSEGYENFNASPTAGNDPHLGAWDNVYTKAAVAIPAVRAYTPDSLKGDFLGQLFAARGYAALQVAEDICPGFPLNDIVDDLPVYGQPMATDSAVRYALTQIDSAAKYLHDSTRYVQLVKVIRGRALLDLGQYADAAAAVTDVPTDFVFLSEGTNVSNTFWAQARAWPRTTRHIAVGNREGGNGLPFVSANDPRVATVFRRVRFANAADSLYDQTKYTGQTDPIVMAGGIEARLIEAEAALHAGDPNWLTILNDLRSTAISPAMPALVDPGTSSAQVDLVYYERGFWLYLTGRRLGDLRREIRNYGRDPETLFPKGAYPLLSRQYGTATAIPFVLESEQRFNPHITSGCTTR